MVLMLSILHAAHVSAQSSDSDYYVGFDIGDQTGDFGSTIDSDLYSFQFVGGVISSYYDASISIPYLSLENDASFKEEGFGDVLFQIGRSLLSEQPNGISMNGSLLVKLPTADENKGLGTGELDIGVLIDINKHWPTFTGNIHAGYINTGDTAAIRYDNSFLYGVSFFKMINRFGNYVSLEGRSATIENTKDPLEIQLGTFYAVNLQDMLTGNIMIGLTDGSPDFGINIGLRHWFN